MAMHDIFRDHALNKKFHKCGYVVLDYTSKIESEMVLNKIKKLSPSDLFGGYQQMNLIPLQSYHCTYFDNNLVYKRLVLEILKDFFRPLVETFLEDYKIIMANLFLKPPFAGYVSPHQNMTIVDESKFTSISLWCPCVDTNEENGTMQIVEGSQKKYASIRGSSILWKYLDYFNDEQNQHLFTKLKVRAGQVVILDDSIVHTTSINKTSVERPVLHSIAVPKHADLFHYYFENNCIKKSAVKEDFWQNSIL
jgi:ectoine hydroxylase-related dioxygenase (phytanoyl-CoA dioxygenase family)